jgi:hypothetical protein
MRSESWLLRVLSRVAPVQSDLIDMVNASTKNSAHRPRHPPSFLSSLNVLESLSRPSLLRAGSRSLDMTPRWPEADIPLMTLNTETTSGDTSGGNPPASSRNEADGTSELATIPPDGVVFVRASTQAGAPACCGPAVRRILRTTRGLVAGALTGGVARTERAGRRTASRWRDGPIAPASGGGAGVDDRCGTLRVRRVRPCGP